LCSFCFDTELLSNSICANDLVCRSQLAGCTEKSVLTTKLTKAAKGSDILLINFVLFVCFVVKILTLVADLPL
jgi:hypothetical protein